MAKKTSRGRSKTGLGLREDRITRLGKRERSGNDRLRCNDGRNSGECDQEVVSSPCEDSDDVGMT